MSLEAHLRAALSQASGSTPILVPIVVYDLPNRDCAALASNGELTVSKPPGESDGDYPSGSHAHGDPHCDPNGTNTDGNGNTYSTGSIPGFDIPAGQWFPAEFQMLVQNAFPAVP